MRLLKHIQRSLNHFLFPSSCRLCHSKLFEDESYQICQPCLDFIQPLSDEERFTFHRDYLKREIDSSFILSHFDNHTRPLLHELKYNHVKSFGRLMGDLIYDGFEKELSSRNYDAILPCPMHQEKLISREYNQAELVSYQIAKKLAIHHDTKSLQRTRNTKTQTKLSKSEREKNLTNAFNFCNEARYRRILIVDDVITTGTTFLSISKSIKSCSPEVMIDVAAFATPYFN